MKPERPVGFWLLFTGGKEWTCSRVNQIGELLIRPLVSETSHSAIIVFISICRFNLTK